MGLGPEQLAGAQRMRCAMRDLVPAGASAERMLAAWGELATLPPRALARLGIDPSDLGVMLRRAAGLVAGLR